MHVCVFVVLIVKYLFIIEKSPGSYVGYLLMEYFPLGNINSILWELKALDKCKDEIKEIDNCKMRSESNEEFGKYRESWQRAVKLRDKINDCCKHLWHGIIDIVLNVFMIRI